MRVPGWVLFLLLPACAKGSARTQPLALPTDTADARLTTERVARIEGTPPALGFEVAAAPALPPRLRTDLQAGRNWLVIRSPRRFSFAGGDLLLGRTLFKPTETSLTFAQEKTATDVPRRDPVLGRLRGRAARADLADRVRPIDDPGITPEGLGALDQTDLRVMLGRGVDSLMALQGSTGDDVHVWVAVVGADRKPVDWVKALGRAYDLRSLAPLEPLHVLVMRRRTGYLPSYFEMVLADVVLASQMKVEVGDAEMAWIWEGVWFGKMEAPPAATTAPDWPDLPLPTLSYTEFQRPSGNLSAFWNVLMKPLALGADVGVTFIEGDPLIEGVAEKQRARE